MIEPGVSIEPAHVLPQQLLEPPLGGARLQPEKRLQVAVLADAVMTYHRWAGAHRGRERRLFAEVAEWFASDATDDPFTFVAICQTLGLEPDYIRRGVRQSDGDAHLARRLTPSIHRDGRRTRERIATPRLRRVA